MAVNHTKVLLLTANVGSIFEEPDKMLPIWLREFLATISRLQPEFIAIHCQEVGGKNYEETMQHVNKFIKMLLASEEMAQFDRARVFLDEDFTAVEKFTALGSLYFIHRSVRVVEILDFYEKKFVPVEGKEVLSGNIEHVHIKEKSKFPQEFFPDFVWSRKGFIRTRWNLNNTLFDLVNIHLFHDISNLAAMEKSPSTYSSHRERALMHTVERFETDEYDKVPFFIFGDFNFRMDTNKLVKELTLRATEERIKGKKNDVSAVLFKEEGDEKVILKVGKKDFHHFNHDEVFGCEKAMSLMIYDTEPFACRNKLFEYSVTFPPSYPFSEKMEEGTSYMPTRCPGWCDRIMMSHTALPLIFNVDGETREYDMIGRDICMGDHKPILLNLKILKNTSAGKVDDDGACHASTISDSVYVKHAISMEIHSSSNTSPDEYETEAELPDGVANQKASLKNVISINGQMVVANDINDINIHNNIKFEMADLVTDKFKNLIEQQQGTTFSNVAGDPTRSQQSPATLGPPGSGTSKLKTTRSFRNVVNNVLKSDSILRYMRRFKHRSESESDDDDDDDNIEENKFKFDAPVVVNADHPVVLPRVENDDAGDCGDDENLNNNNNNNNNISNNIDFERGGGHDVVATTTGATDVEATTSPQKHRRSNKKRCSVQ